MAQVAEKTAASDYSIVIVWRDYDYGFSQSLKLHFGRITAGDKLGLWQFKRYAASCGL